MTILEARGVLAAFIDECERDNPGPPILTFAQTSRLAQMMAEQEPKSIAFLVDAALTQARMAWRTDDLAAISKHLESVIEMLTEIKAKVG